MYVDPDISRWLTTLTPVDIADLPVARVASAKNQVRTRGANREYRGHSGGPWKVIGHGSRVIVNIHGGGFVLGSTSSDDPENELLARKLGCTVVSPEYGLAPENPYPGPLTQCCQALTWVVDNLDPHPVVMGHSAGGGLAAMVTQWALDQGIELGAQVLIEPEVDPRCASASMKTYAEGPVWTKANGELSWQYLLQGERVEVPARLAPPTYVIVNQSDPLRDEGIAYALRLADAGTPVTLKMYPGTVHGSMSCMDAAVTRKAYEELLAFLKAAFSRR